MNSAPMNPALSDLRDIHLPAPVSWWPPAPGWWLLGALLIALLLGLYVWRRRRTHERWRRFALEELASLRARCAEQPTATTGLLGELSVLLRRVALSRFPRQDVAALSGESWLAFLGQALGDTAAFRAHGDLLCAGPYMRDAAIDTHTMQTLFDLCERWLRALPRGRK